MREDRSSRFQSFSNIFLIVRFWLPARRQLWRLMAGGFIAIPIAIGSFLPTACCFSQSYNFKNYSADEGLPYVQVYAIFQDNKGNLWTGGYGGLSKFDGKQFTNYSPKNGLANHYVTSIAEDAKGNIWVGTISGLSRLDGGRFTTFTTAHGLAGNHIRSLSADKNGNLWISTTGGVTIFNGKTFTSLTTANGLSSNNVSLVFADRNGNIWLSSDSGVSKIAFLQGKTPQDKSFDNYYVENKIYRSPVTSITEDGNGNMWFGTGQGVVEYNGVDFKNYSVKNGLCSNEIQSLVKDEHSNCIWVGTMSGLNKISENGKVESLRVGETQNGNKVSRLFVDTEGNLWLGTFNGLYRFRDPSFATYTARDGLINTMVYPIFRDKKGALWVGTDEGVFKYENHSFKNYSEKDGLAGTRMGGIAQDKWGNLWMGANKGVSVYDGKTFLSFRGKKDGLKSDSVTAVLADSKGRIWLGGNQGGTLYTPSADGVPGNGKLKPFELKTGQGSDIWCEFEDSRGNIWLGTYVGGLFCYDGKTFQNYSDKLGLKSKTFLAIAEDRDGVLYFGSFDGVYVYDPSSQKISCVSEKDGLSSDLVYILEFDASFENLYIGTNQGLNQFSVKEYKRSGSIRLKQYGIEEGFSSLETNSGGVWRDPDGTFWFGTVNGLIHFNPALVHINHTESRTTIRGIRIFYNDTLLPDQAELPYSLNNISFEYVGICLTNPEKVRYRFMLEGFEKKWSPETRETFARYSNLPPGHYTFKVISCNDEGLWNKKPAAFSFSILPPLWRRGWFLASALASVVLLIVVVFRIRTEAIRKKEAEKLSREIQLANNELKALRAQMDPHFIFNSLSSIQSFIMTKDEESALRYLNKFARLMRMILSNSEKSSITIREEIDAARLYLELEALRWENKFEYRVDTDGIDADDYKIPSMLIQPYVENAIIHGVVPKENGKGRIEIRIVPNGTHLVCTITDNGIGRKKSQELKARSGSSLHESMGMKITSERLEVLNKIHRSSLSVNITDLQDENGNAAGTKVELFIPV